MVLPSVTVEWVVSKAHVPLIILYKISAKDL
ncbi:hypothetical protein SAMN02746065_101337 [Desulfocicer vacuolatum DSM 3385]|uniref:Uncharacterized protein n=1 Tax=Desulfocicer vacuolatum DSM 3385 TaxID=1121400 RepID=A0A1W1YST4_9BACT|nr:hypothetical protein SAMN02746065_101337 [Desulfocicer vacuolatum DSM 3385]